MFLRAIAHFDLCRVYSLPYTVDAQSMGIPIITAPMSAADIVDINSERGTVEDVYTFVIEQLTEAATLIDDNTQTYGFANSWTCKALLSRVYLYKGDNTNALSVAEDIINNSPYTLWANSNYKTEWSAEGGSSESIFEIVNFDTSDWVDKESIGYLYAAAGYADMIATPKLVDYFTANPDDVRGTVLVSSNLAVFDGMEYEGLNVFVLKYPGRASTGYEPGVSNIPVLRLSEIYLNAAEAAQKLGQSTLADTYVNAIAGRNPGVSYTGATLEEILWERGIELYAEGHRKFDLLRNNMTITRQNPSWGYIFTENASISYDNDYYRALLPIPISELNANPSLRNQQNPGYGSN